MAAVVAVGLMFAFWWRVSGSKPALEDALLTDAQGRPADLAALPADLRDAVARTLREGRLSLAAPGAEARSQVPDAARRAELDRVRQPFAGFPLVMAVALARAGLVDEAAGKLGELARAHPQSAAAERLRRGLESARFQGRDRER